MDLLQKQITHKTFGNGVIVKMISNIITVRFTEEIGKKQFLYPEAFEHFLVMDDPNLQTVVANDLKIKLKKSKEKRLLKEKQEEKVTQKRAMELNKLAEERMKKIVTKKLASKKKAVKKAALKS